MGPDRGSRHGEHPPWLRVIVIVFVGVGGLLLGAALAYVGISVYDADDPEAADAGIACLLVSALIVGSVVLGGFRYVRRGG